MAMFGALSNQALGILPGDRPDYGMGDFTRISDPNGAMTGPTRKPGFFGQGGVGRGILGVIGDALAASNGFSPVFTQGRIQNQQRSRDLEDEQRKRQQALEDAVALTQAKAQFREPTALEQNVGFLNKFKPGLGDNYAQNFSNPMQTIDAAQPDGSVIRQFIRPPVGGGVPNGSPTSPGAGAPPPQAIMDLQRDPSLAAQFDAKFGAGLSARILGGR